MSEQQLKDEITKLMDMLKQIFPDKKSTVTVAKIQLVPLLILVPKQVAHGIITAFKPYIEYMASKDIEKLGDEVKLPKVNLPGIPTINLSELVGELNTEKRKEIAKKCLAIYDRAQEVLSGNTNSNGKGKRKRED